MTQVPRAAQWATQAEAGQPPERLFDFPDLCPGDRFRPAPGAYIGVRWLPRTFAWRATALIESITGDRLEWTEENRILGRPFAARVVFRRTGPFAARLEIDPRLGKMRGPRMAKDYEVIIAQRDLIALRGVGDAADMLCVGRQTGSVMQFHLRLPLGVAIHKSGDLEHRRGAGSFPV